jgi:hypothetical protein
MVTRTRVPKPRLREDVEPAAAAHFYQRTAVVTVAQQLNFQRRG